MFSRPHHQRIASLLSCFDAAVLEKAECFFGGGTAIALQLGEYRESVDVDFLCSSEQGFRLIRNLVGADLGSILKHPVEHLREVRSSQYKVLTFLRVDGASIKVEFVRESNTQLSGYRDAVLGVPVLSRVDLWAQKLMANADRALDRSTQSRDIIDLAMMIRGWGAIPKEALDKAVRPYGEQIYRGFFNALKMVSDPMRLKKCLEAMRMDSAEAPAVFASIWDASASLPEHAETGIERLRRSVALQNLGGGSHPEGALLMADVTRETSPSWCGQSNWGAVEREVVCRSHARGLPSDEIVRSILAYSPGCANPARAAVVGEAIESGALAMLCESVSDLGDAGARNRSAHRP